MEKGKIVVIMPACNVAHVLSKTISAIPKNFVDAIIVIDDGSKDGTDEVARKMGVEVISHEKRRGYGATQKTGYREAIKRNAAAVVMVHGDNQYDPSLVPQFVSKVVNEDYDVVTGTRMVLGDALSHGMPLWKFIPNRFLTWLENLAFQTNLSDYHNGYRAFKTSFLKQVPLAELSDHFDFDTDIIVQAAIRKVRIAEVPHPTRYKDENSQMSFKKGVIYGLSILKTVLKYWFHRARLRRQKRFEGV